MVTGWSWNSLLVGLGGWLSSFLIRILFHYWPACENYLVFQAPSWSMFLISMCHKTFDPYSCLSTMCSKPLQYVEFTCQTYMRLSYYVGSIHVHILWEARCWNIRFFSSPFAWAALLFLFNYILDFIYLFFHFNRKKEKKKKMNILRLGHHEGHIYLGKFFYIILNAQCIRHKLCPLCSELLLSLSLSLKKSVTGGGQFLTYEKTLMLFIYSYSNIIIKTNWLVVLDSTSLLVQSALCLILF